MTSSGRSNAPRWRRARTSLRHVLAIALAVSLSSGCILRRRHSKIALGINTGMVVAGVALRRSDVEPCADYLCGPTRRDGGTLLLGLGLLGAALAGLLIVTPPSPPRESAAATAAPLPPVAEPEPAPAVSIAPRPPVPPPARSPAPRSHHVDRLDRAIRDQARAERCVVVRHLMDELIAVDIDRAVLVGADADVARCTAGAT